MAKLIAIFLLTVLLVLFAFANSHDVELSYVIGEPIRIRLVVLLAVAFGAGALTATFYQLFNDLGHRRRIARRRLALRARDDFAEEEL